MKKIFLFLSSIIVFFILINISNVIAICEENQIDINLASKEDLDKLSGIGTVKAQAIIDSRPFQKLDELIDVVGIGEVTLANIKQQGLACVENEEKQEEEKNNAEEQEEEIEEDEEENEVEEEIEEGKIEPNLQTTQEITPEKVETIFLSPKSIKTEKNKEQLDKNKLGIYGLIMLCISLVFLFRLKKTKNEKNEFK